MFEFTTRTDLPHVSSTATSTVHVLIEVKTPPAPQRPRLPLHLGLVIDVSGSMAGAKLDATKESLRHLLRRLSLEDQVALIAYDNTVRLVGRASGRDKQRLIHEVDRLQVGGSTNLSGGWLEGLTQVKRWGGEEGLHRVLLLTDGQANAGVVDRDQLAAIGRQGLEDGIRTTTLGFGADYDEDLLARIADESGGNSYYIAAPDHAADAFLEELGELGSVVGQNLELFVGCEQGVTLVDATDFPGRRDAQEAQFRVGDLYADDVTCVLLTLQVEPGAEGQRTLAAVGLRYRDVHAAGAEVRDVGTVKLQSLAQPPEALQDPAVLRELLLHKAARAKEAAVRLADAGRHAEARAALERELGELRGALGSDTCFAQLDRDQLERELTQSVTLREEFSEATYSSMTRKEAMMQTIQSRKKRGDYSTRPSSNT